MKRIRLALTCLLLAITATAFGQNIQVRGNVTDSSNGEPVPYAAVQIKGTTVGTTTDANGVYNISAPANGVLVVSSVGYQTQEIAVEGRSLINCILAVDTEFLDDVLVVAYGTATKGSFTGSAAVVKSEKLEKRMVSNVSQALAGQVAGVQILSANGQPGASATVRVRGTGSINASMNPLYVVDGIPFDGDLSSINAQDIESITVQKDAVSTALYGARGANGVIMITTKKGKSGNAVINFETRIGQNSRAIKNYDVMTSTQEYVEKVYQAIYNAGFYNIDASKGNAAASNAYANEKIFTETGGGFGYQIYTVPSGQSLIGTDGKLNSAATLGYGNDKYWYTPDNWADVMFSNNLRQEYNINISAANERSNYYASFGMLDDQGVIDNSGLRRFSGRLKADYQAKSWLKVGGNMAYTYSISAYPGEQTTTNSSGNAFFLANMIAPVYPIYVRNADKSIMYNTVYNRPVYDYGNAMTDFSRTFMSISNPKGDLSYNITEYLMDIMNLNWFAEISPVRNLTLTARYGLHIDNTRYNDLGNALYGQSAEYGGTAYQEASRVYGFDQQYVANYKFEIDRNSFDITAGYDGYSYESVYVDASGQNLYNPDSYYVNNAIDQIRGYGARNTYATQGYFAFLNYNWGQKYFATVSYRRDASSRFAPEHRWGNFFSGSAAWILSNEDFLKNHSWIDFLKLKASIGQQGNDKLGTSSYYYYAYLDQYRMTGADGVFADGTLAFKGNPEITWETQTSWNVGAEFTLLRQRLNGSLEYFGRRSKDMLYNKPTPNTAGYASIPMNIGSMQNSGIELDLNGDVIKTNYLTWNINANATLLKNKIIALHPDLKGRLIDGSRVYEEGYSMYRMWLVKYAGVEKETGLAQYWAREEDAEGKYTGKEYLTTDWQKASASNKCATADLLPKVYGGFGTTLSAYGFDLSVQCSYQLGGRIYDSGYAALMHGGTTSNAGRNWHVDIRNSWTSTNTDTDVPRVDTSDQYANSTSDRFIISSNYLSLNNVTLGYTVPSRISKSIGVEKIRISASGDNLALLTARKGLDPRQSYTSATTALYTPIRTISGGINLTF